MRRPPIEAVVRERNPQINLHTFLKTQDPTPVLWGTGMPVGQLVVEFQSALAFSSFERSTRSVQAVQARPDLQRVANRGFASGRDVLASSFGSAAVSGAAQPRSCGVATGPSPSAGGRMCD